MLSCYRYDSTIHVTLFGMPPPGSGKFPAPILCEGRPCCYALAV